MDLRGFVWTKNPCGRYGGKFESKGLMVLRKPTGNLLDLRLHTDIEWKILIKTELRNLDHGWSCDAFNNNKVPIFLAFMYDVNYSFYI